MASESVQGRDCNEQFACERAYETAESCLMDAMFISGEREYHGVFILVRSALQELRVIGRITQINGQKRLEANNGR